MARRASRDGRRASVRAAALINGAAAHTVEVDDIYRDGIYHPGAPTIAAALARRAAQAPRASVPARGDRRLRDLDPHRRGDGPRRTTSTGTTPAPSAASARRAPPPRCSGWTRARFAHALATVTTFAAGLQQAFRSDSMSKPMHAGRAAEAGVTAALAARGRRHRIARHHGRRGGLSAGRWANGPDWERALPRWARTSTSAA